MDGHVGMAYKTIGATSRVLEDCYLLLTDTQADRILIVQPLCVYPNVV